MTIWLVEFCPQLDMAPDQFGQEREVPCFRIFPEDSPQQWIVQTNPNLPREVQEEAALIMANALSKALG